MRTFIQECYDVQYRYIYIYRYVYIWGFGKFLNFIQFEECYDVQYTIDMYV